LLQRAQHGLGIGCRLHPKQVEMVDRQFQPRSFADNGL
jgi:citrate lyase beta subunit